MVKTVPGSSLAARALVVGAAAGLLAACGSSGTHPASSSTSASSAAGATTSTAAGGGSLSDLQSSLTAGEHATFKAVYSSSDSSGTQTVTIEQAPPKSLFKANSGELLSDGTTTYYCGSSSGSAPSCLAVTGPNPLASIVSIYRGATYLPIFQAAETEIAAHLAGVNVSYTDETFAGQRSKCVSISGGSAGQGGKYCVTDSGILAYVGSGSTNFRLTSYSSTAPASDFALPAGATTQTLPSSVTLPGGVTIPQG